MIKEQLNVLINLAASDRTVGDKEAKVIHIIGKANGLTKEEIEAMLKKPQPIGDLSALTEDQKFENLYHLIQLMKSDGQVFKSEIHFCEQMAEKLGYKKAVVGELSSKIYSDPTITSDRKALVDRAHKFLK
ncbi:MAG TPA: TerB family tellurite resistance protein [Cyclobacteriaceae bacterium]|nr:TerB family tellurite resistance protein [Cyclobacteriaceae bacterium]HPW61229.1 TerB family tellurite resistance protein [Cyclobacteriaceae bacterium]HRG79244.1 TerB family tellurite resistance protein [Cyclobacteriaceae bacterium]